MLPEPPNNWVFALHQWRYRNGFKCKIIYKGAQINVSLIDEVNEMSLGQLYPTIVGYIQQIFNERINSNTHYITARKNSEIHVKIEDPLFMVETNSEIYVDTK